MGQARDDSADARVASVGVEHVKAVILGTEKGSERKVSLRCPHCGHQGTFDHISQSLDVVASEQGGSPARRLMIRRCPNPECFGMIFVVGYKHGALVESVYPPTLFDFEPEGLPPAVLAAFEEAVKCEAAGCYRAAALLVRRTLEEVCDDQGASGASLYARLESLDSKVTLPHGFLAGLHDLRLLGNDAAHIDLRDFDEVGAEEASLALEMTKLLLQPLYQYGGVMARLAARKRATS